MSLRIVRSDPKAAKILFPQYANVALAQLESYPQFTEFGNMLAAGLKFVLNNAADMKFLRTLLGGKSTKSFFAADVPIDLQLEVHYSFNLITLCRPINQLLQMSGKCAHPHGIAR